MIIAVSQSGETADTLPPWKRAPAGWHLLAITNTVDSSIARKADAIYTRCGPESASPPPNVP